MSKKIGIIRELIGCYRFAHEMERVIDDILLHTECDGDGRVQTMIRKPDGSRYCGLDMLLDRLKEYRRKALLFDKLQIAKDQGQYSRNSSPQN